MKKFIQNIFLFSLFVFLTLFLIQSALFLRFYGKTVHKVDNLEQTTNINVDLVLLGSSRCWVHFDPLFFEKQFNLSAVNIGVDGHSELTMTILRLKNYLLRNKPPKYAILNFDPLVHAGSLTTNTNVIHKDYYARYAFFPNEINQPIVDYFQFNAAEKYLPMYSIFRYQLLLSYCSLKPRSQYLVNGNYIVDRKWNMENNTVANRKELTDRYFKKSEVPSIQNKLKELKVLCASNNIRLLCIQTPVYKDVYNKTSFEETKRICKSVGVPFVDTNVSTIINESSYFYNASHLNKLGVERMNSYLQTDTTLLTFFKH